MSFADQRMLEMFEKCASELVATKAKLEEAEANLKSVQLQCTVVAADFRLVEAERNSAYIREDDTKAKLKNIERLGDEMARAIDEATNLKLTATVQEMRPAFHALCAVLEKWEARSK